MTGYKEGKEIRGRFKELIERMERWEIEEMRAIEEGKRLIEEIVWEEAYRRFGKLNEIESEAIRERIRLLQKVWEELVKVMEKMEIVELYEKIERYREYIWKSPEQIEFVEWYLIKMFYSIKKRLLLSKEVKMKRKN